MLSAQDLMLSAPDLMLSAPDLMLSAPDLMLRRSSGSPPMGGVFPCNTRARPGTSLSVI